MSCWNPCALPGHHTASPAEATVLHLWSLQFRKKDNINKGITDKSMPAAKKDCGSLYSILPHTVQGVEGADRV